jgi:hypothetical protein
MKKYIALLGVCFLTLQTLSQYTLLRSAKQPDPNNSRCYTITPNQAEQKGAVWNNNQVDFRHSFEFSFDVNLAGTYVWMASVRNLYTSESKVLKGNVFLIR